ncbi:MAG: hypothetical protein II998_09885 [Clostridia bacterium]|nr:hypothetical protein [Clostridia bacterium]
MTKYRVETNSLVCVSDKLNSIKREVSLIGEEIFDVAHDIDFKLNAATMINRKLMLSFNNVKAITDKCEKMSTSALNIADMYSSYENRISEMNSNEIEVSTMSGFGNLYVKYLKNDVQETRDAINRIDELFHKIPVEERNVLKAALSEVLKYQDVSLIDLYDIYSDIESGNINIDTFESAIDVLADYTGVSKITLWQSVDAVKDVIGKYIAESQELDKRTWEYFSDNEYLAGIFTSTITHGGVIIKGVTDSFCNFVDKTLHLSDVGNLVKKYTGWDIPGALRDTGEFLSDTFDTITDFETYRGIYNYFCDLF